VVPHEGVLDLFAEGDEGGQQQLSLQEDLLQPFVFFVDVPVVL
jgi:hypothetical protein